MKNSRYVLRQVIKKNLINTVFQPINDLLITKIIGYEALTRGPGPYHSPKNLFHSAMRADLLQEMEMACFKNAVNSARYLPGLIFLNFNPSTVIANYKEILHEIEQLRDRTVLELAETGLRDKDRDDLATIIQELRSKGIKIALDDIGSGDRDFSNICELPADYIKIDRVFIRGITKHKNGSASHYIAGLNMLVELAEQLGSQVIAEGVETEMQLAGVKRAGINLVQGFYFSKPGPVEKWVAKTEKGVLAKC